MALNLLSKFCRQINNKEACFYCTGQHIKNIKVAICGAGGQVGQMLAFQLKNCPLIDEIALYDLNSTNGTATDLNFIDTKPKVFSYRNRLKEALENSSIVVITAAHSGVSLSNENAMFNANAKIVSNIATQIAHFCPTAMVAIATSPINSMVPLFHEIMKKCLINQPQKIFGVTTLNVIRTNTLVAKMKGFSPENVFVPVIGGHSVKTLVPLTSHTKPLCEFTKDEYLQLAKNLQENDCSSGILCSPSAALPCAFAISRFVQSLIRALKGEKNIVECAFVRSEVYADLDYLATPLRLGTDGIQNNLGLPLMVEYESRKLQESYSVLKQDIERGNEFVGTVRKILPEFQCETRS